MSDSHELLGIVVPSNSPNVLYRYFLGSLQDISELSEFSTVLYNLQGDNWSPLIIDNIVRITTYHGFKCKILQTSYEIRGKGEIPMCRIRQDAASLLPSAKFYLCLDDDISFVQGDATHYNSGRFYLMALHYLVTHNKCGLVLLRNSRAKGKLGKNIVGASQWDGSWVTGLGIMCRSVNGRLFPQDSLELVGSDEEKIMSYYRLVNGYYPARLDYVRARHWENNSQSKSSKDTAISGVVQYKWNSMNILDSNVNQYLSRTCKNFSNNGVKPTVILDYQYYLEKGGIDYTTGDFSVDYSNKSTQSIMEDIRYEL